MTTTHDTDRYAHTTTDLAPSPSTNDAAQMRDVFAAKFDEAQREHDEIGIRIYGDCVNHWTRKAQLNEATL